MDVEPGAWYLTSHYDPIQETELSTSPRKNYGSEASAVLCGDIRVVKLVVRTHSKRQDLLSTTNLTLPAQVPAAGTRRPSDRGFVERTQQASYCWRLYPAYFERSVERHRWIM